LDFGHFAWADYVVTSNVADFQALAKSGIQVVTPGEFGASLRES
jgi:hypothetical protein